MRNGLKIILYTLLFSAVLGGIGFMYLIHKVSTNFVHDKPADPLYYEQLSGRISFSIPAGVDGQLDSLLDTFVLRHPEYAYSDSLAAVINRVDTLNYIASMDQLKIHFQKNPEEVYLITFDKEQTKYGYVENVYIAQDGKWKCIPTSRLDSMEKRRVERRLETEVITGLGERHKSHP